MGGRFRQSNPYRNSAESEKYLHVEKMSAAGIINHLSMRHRVDYKKIDVHRLSHSELVTLHTSAPMLEGKSNRAFIHAHTHGD
jgi:hypothetical protein